MDRRVVLDRLTAGLGLAVLAVAAAALVAGMTDRPRP
jgi:hypothetical protein